MNYNEAVNYIFGLRKFGMEPGAVRAKRALCMLENPDKELNIIHIAGTNGKGSVCAYISNSLIEMGYSVGMFTSPHLVRVNERIRLNNDLISNEDFLKYFNIVYEVSEHLKKDGYDGLAFFDYVFVMAMLYYRDNKPDYVVLETGLGGKNDATASVSNKLVSVITSISPDHTEILGDTIEKIALEKAGIICSGKPLVYCGENAEVSRVLEDYAAKCNSLTYSVDEKNFEIIKIGRNNIDFSLKNKYYKNSMFTVSSPGLYQVMNASIAIETLRVTGLLKDDNLEAVQRAVKNTCWDGRMEEIAPGIYLDGAHNPDGIRKLLDTACRLGGGHKQYLMFGAVCDKDYSSMIENICKSGCFDGYIITEIHNSRELPGQAMKAVFERYTDKPVTVIDDNQAAFNYARTLLGEEDVLICAGSLYLVGAIKAMTGE